MGDRLRDKAHTPLTSFCEDDIDPECDFVFNMLRDQIQDVYTPLRDQVAYNILTYDTKNSA